jgi:hypothetical protein
MDNFNSLFQKRHMGQLLLSVLFVIYLIMGYKTPDKLAAMVDTMWGKVVVAALALMLFAHANPVLGVLGLIVAYEFIVRSSHMIGASALARAYPTEEYKWSPFSQENQFPMTLEQEVVKNMTPLVNSEPNGPATFKPILDPQYDAAPINAGL